jgi:co-chaperonin GroES (HSP10)
VTLRPDLVLVALPPRERLTTGAGVVVLPAPSIIVDRNGLVLLRGARVTTVDRFDEVLFGSDVGEEVRIDDWPCLVLREQDIDAVIERDHG